MNKKPLQIASAVLAMVPLVSGALTMLGVHDPLYKALALPAAPLLDSNLRFLGGVWLGIGLGALWMVPSIERQTLLFRLIWGAIFIGGIGRLLSMWAVGLPPLPFVAFTGLEVIGAPLFILWQRAVAAAYAAR